MKNIVKILLGLLLIFVILNFIFPLRVHIDYSKVVYDRNGEILSTFLNKSDKWRFKTDLNHISEDFKNAMLQKEDKYFYYHFGFNPVSIINAAYNNLVSGEIVSGASTITMQLARLLEPKDRTIGNKIVELFRSIQLEIFYSKDEILNMYLDLIPFGSNLEGIKAASIFYLDKKPISLSLSESIALSLIPNNPNYLKIGKYNQRINRVKNEYIDKYIKNNTFDNKRLTDAKNEMFYSERVKRHKFAMHLSTRLINENRIEQEIHSTIDYSIQSQIEALTSSYISGLNFRGIHNASVLVINNESGEVVSYLGSNDFQDKRNAGEVDGVQAIRSPGSTLKPIVYLLAIEEGLITPKRKLLDIPFTFGSYSPLNFDRNFNGEVTAEKSLSKSLNVPAVFLLNEIGNKRFINSLVKLGFSSISEKKDELGLSVVLGGCGVSLEELTKLYFCFANNGVTRDLNYIKEDNDTSKTLIFNPQATAITSDILSKLTRPDYPSSYEYAYRLPKISWKTGTSYGRKDAWSIGFSDKYTIGVWIGNFNNKSVATLTGASVATPLLFDVFNILEANKHESTGRENIELPQRAVCSKTGLIPSSKCTDIIQDYFLPFKSSFELCNHINEIFVSLDESLSYCSSCLPESNYKLKDVENIDPLLINYYKENQISYNQEIKHNPNCSRTKLGSKPKILSPLEDQAYILNEDIDKIKLSSIISNQAKECTWYINNELYMENSSGKLFFKPEKEGRYKITCTDNLGETSTVFIEVNFI